MGCCWRTIVDQNHEPKDGLFCNVIVRDPVQQNTWIYDSNGIYSEGTAGKAATITVGATTTGEPGTDAKVENVGDVSQAVLNFTIPRGDKGDKGDKGEQGDQGPEGQQGVQGEKGDPGEPFQIRKIYSSVDEMEADYNNPGIEEGDFVLIETGNVEDPDNSKLYVKGPTGWQFVTDLSGAQGIQGPKGDTGSPAGFGSLTATVDDTVGTPAVSVQSDGPNTAKNIAFNFSGLKGEKGDPGQAGTEVNNLAPLVVSTAPVAGDEDSIAIGDRANASAGGYVAIGDGARASGATMGGYGSVSVGIGTTSENRGVAIGNGAHSDGFAVAIGYRADTGGNTQSVVIGYQSTAAASCNSPTAVGSNVSINDTNATALGYRASIGIGGKYSVSLGSYSSTAEPNVVSVGSGDATMSLSDDMDEETRARVQARAAAVTRRIVNVTDPQNAQDAATKNYVDTQLTPINAKLQYVPENTNQILSQIETNVEKAQSAADAKVASITAGTGISVDASNPTAPVVSTVGLATQASVDDLTTTVNSKANQTDLEALQTTVAGKADTSALANYATKTELNAKADQSAVDAKVSSVTAGTGISITGSATNPVINATGGDSYITKSSSLEEAYAIGGDAVNHRANEVTVGSVEPSGGFLQPGEFTRLIAGVSTPTNRYDAANKLYVDQQVQKMVAVPDYANGVKITTNDLTNGLWTAPSSGVVIPFTNYVATGPAGSSVKYGLAKIYDSSATSVSSNSLASFGFMFGGLGTYEGCQMPVPIEAGCKFASGEFTDGASEVDQSTYTTGGTFYPYKFVEIS